MAVSVLSVARTLGDLSGWGLSNLELQKISFMADMIHMGRNGGVPLVLEHWEAWERGPVAPALYHKAKVFGSSPVKDIFSSPKLKPGTPEYESVKDAYELLKDKTPGQMVRITHWENGAWAKRYRPGLTGITIPKGLIFEEYRARTAPKH